MTSLRWALAVLALTACGNHSGGSTDAPGTGIDGSTVDENTGVVIMTDGGTWTCYPVLCAGKSLECNDCMDNDGDGRVDSHDPECLGPCDNTEGPGLESGVGGTTGSSCGVDCYFDYGNGPGNDECLWDHRCDSLEPELPKCAYDSKIVGSKDCPATQDPLCAQVCMPFTPNGCDCFGCCTFPNAGPGGSGSRSVWIGAMDSSNNSTCTLADIADETKCPSCTPVSNCYNPCDMCEVCVGGGLPDPSCDPSMQCGAGYQACGLAGQAECPMGTYCVTGCCQAVIL